MKSRKMLKQSGFTLVEMALVLVIIGLILGAVSIGKDLQRSSEYKKIKQKFVDQWEQAYNQHYLRTGVVVGDRQEGPTLAVNAAINEIDSDPFFAADLQGDYSAVAAPGRLCETASNDGYAGNRAMAAGVSLHAQFDQAGIRMPPGRTEGREDRYVYLDSNGNPQEIQICFQWNNPGTPSGSGNVMVLVGLTPDLARMLDEMIDGQAHATEGRFREQRVATDDGNGNVTEASDAAAWTFTNVDAAGAQAAAAAGDAVLDEDQIVVITAHYKMNQ